jgi:hypothetical protein
VGARHRIEVEHAKGGVLPNKVPRVGNNHEAPVERVMNGDEQKVLPRKMKSRGNKLSWTGNVWEWI